MKKTIIVNIVLGLMCVISGLSQATLVINSDGTVTDTITNLMWMRNAGNGGYMSWYDSMTMANNISFAGYDDWRMAEIGELVNLFHVEGIRSSQPGPFQNINWKRYISATEVPDIPSTIYLISFNSGSCVTTPKTYAGDDLKIMVVRTIPEPTAMLLLGLGGIWLVRELNGKSKKM